ncbi:peptidoglycan-binding protein [Acinetobacter baumannii]|uniref:Peptidoglycan-binding protein n=1 Tax=Acinetobacter baumannii TaxID=470 RepID=A0AAP1FDU0_ACIBA|nr:MULTISPECIES: putative peptidoglycan-binding domain-containing protein [Enterobacteriaceae]AIL77899.1 peptidoglycan-binding protein [Acinetobacter baumannii]RSC55631.1 peptidoglycan-binding protein [Acinetobacter sp. FDAARGOS_558]AIS05935.1 peptidoglycan-binding protein [Acinetobacter baumannii]ANA37175.1 peptidoglycan-binding protein [Acinetobacter baumannii]ANC38353.1 peptidoglycan-binding protein [Acinetobacter baumannii]
MASLGWKIELYFLLTSSLTLAKCGKEGGKVLVRVLNIMQGQRYIEICERNPTQEQFFYGWIANRVSL